MKFKVSQNSIPERELLGDYNWRTHKFEGGMTPQEFSTKYPQNVVTSTDVNPEWGWAFYDENKNLLAQQWDTSG